MMIATEQLTKNYDGVTGLAPLSITVAAGEQVGVCGPSGCGKTTLLRLIAGLEVPSAGRVLIDGETVSTPDRITPPHLRGIGFVFQSGALWPHLSVARNITFGLNGMSPAAARERCGELLAAMQLTGYEQRRPDELSAGQARRVALARALAPRPRILLLDEPLTNLDAELKAGLLELIREQATAATMVYVSHDAEEVSAATQRCIRIDGHPD